LVGENLERRAGIEPAYTGFADLRVSHFATGACEAVVSFQWLTRFHLELRTAKLKPDNCN
jgi:hypothetical protein